MGLIWRLWLVVLIPYRILLELVNCYISNPRTRRNYSPASNSNGNALEPHNNSDQPAENDPSRLTGENRKKLDESVEAWWGPRTPLQGLQRMNRVRMPIIIEAYIKNVLGREFTLDDLSKPQPLLGARICDVGCGGGFLSEALADAGAKVTGVDLNLFDLLAAKTHWKNTRGEIAPPDYQHLLDPEHFSQDHQGEFDVVVCSELLEHLEDPWSFLSCCCRLVRPGGCLIITTNNRTLSALAFALIWLEHLAAIIPLHTHQLYKFIKPEEIEQAVGKVGLKTTNVVGYLPLGLTAGLRWRLQWILTSFTGVWYAHVSVKT